MKNKLSILCILFTLFSCENKKEVNNDTQYIDNSGSVELDMGYNRIKIVKMRDCEYLLWSTHNGSGAMLHCEDCSNPKHLSK